MIATKGGFVRGSSDFASIHAIGADSYLRQSARLSARRLGVERIDLYYLHSGRATDVAFERQIETLAGLQAEGVIRHIGLSNVTVEQLAAARDITQIAAVTAHFNLADRTNQPLLDAAEAAGAVFVPWQPVSLIPPRDARTDVNGSARIKAVVEPIAEEHGATSSQVSLAWLLQHSPAILPIPGTTNIEHLRQNLDAENLQLSVNEVEEINTLAV